MATLPVAGADLTEIVGHHDGGQLAGFAVEEANVEVRPLAARAVRLIAHDAERFRRRRHYMQHGVIGLAARARDVLGFVQSLLAQAFLDGFKSHVHGQQVTHIGFG